MYRQFPRTCELGMIARRNRPRDVATSYIWRGVMPKKAVQAARQAQRGEERARQTQRRRRRLPADAMGDAVRAAAKRIP